jgi:hypothetical protein
MAVPNGNCHLSQQFLSRGHAHPRPQISWYGTAELEHPAAEEWIDQLWYIYSVEYYPAVKAKSADTCYA